jgi:hypothetical protein
MTESYVKPHVLSICDRRYRRRRRRHHHHHNHHHHHHSHYHYHLINSKLENPNNPTTTLPITRRTEATMIKQPGKRKTIHAGSSRNKNNSATVTRYSAILKL